VQKDSSGRPVHRSNILEYQILLVEREEAKFKPYLTLLFAAACSATNCMDSGDTVRKKPAI
jgi:hypothetical protein